MTKRELEKEVEEKAETYSEAFIEKGVAKASYAKGYLAGAEPREKRIAELEMTVGTLRTFSNEQATCIERLEAQIEKMKNCKNCANYMISGKCPSFFRTGWCKNWEMTRSKK